MCMLWLSRLRLPVLLRFILKDMGTVLIDNFDYRGKRFLDGRQCVATVAELRSYPMDTIPEGFEVYCEENGRWYIYRQTNEDNVVSGRFRGRDALATSAVGILPFDGIIDAVTDLSRPGLNGIYFCCWDSLMRELRPDEENQSRIGYIGIPAEYNTMSGTTAVHASVRHLFRYDNRLYGYDMGSNALCVLGYEGETGGGNGDSECQCTSITNTEIDRLIDGL